MYVAALEQDPTNLVSKCTLVLVISIQMNIDLI